MRARFLLGPAGSGKTFRCLAEIRAELLRAPEGAPLILLAPKQATFQYERQLLADNSLAGYARLQILSFERLADFILGQLNLTSANVLSDEGRIMVLRALLAQNKDHLKIFRGSARLPGFAQQLSILLRELQRHQLSPDALVKLCKKVDGQKPLRAKLHDIGLLLGAYFQWLEEHNLQDANRKLDLAAGALQRVPGAVRVAHLWLDGFAEMTPQELELLAAFIPGCGEVTLAFCLDPEDKSPQPISDLSIWSGVNRTFEDCRSRLQRLPDCEIVTEPLRRDATRSRFADSKPLRHLEEHWLTRKPFLGDEPLADSLRMAVCSSAENEAILAAHEILRFVRRGGRFRNVAVLLRQFNGYHDALRRVFTRYEIPFFLDRRESVAHHPLADLTRSALRMAAFGLGQDDFFCALKSGLVTEDEQILDQLENEALARGWKDEAWLQPLKFDANETSLVYLEEFRQRIVPPFQRFTEKLSAGDNPDGRVLSETIRRLWSDLKVEAQLDQWAAENPIHKTVFEQMETWLENIETGFANRPLRLQDWLPICESGLAGLTAGAIPPALDQVLIGTVDRSRNPDLELVFVLGLNEGIFPAPPKRESLLSEADHAELGKLEVTLGPGKLAWLGRERFFGYIAFTRARKHLVLTRSSHDSEGRTLNSSPFCALLHRLFPTLREETFSPALHWFHAQHRCELISPLMRGHSVQVALLTEKNPKLDFVREQIESSPPDSETLSPALAEKLYGKTLHTSVSSLEQFAACPFRFFISAGLRAEERKFFEADAREKGSFQHAILARFHEQLQREDKKWRDLLPADARNRIGAIGEILKGEFRAGLFQSDASNDFAASTLIEALKDFVEINILWTKQYDFNPRVVELGFGVKNSSLPAWEIDLDQGRTLAFRGIIDRIDVCQPPDGKEAMAVIIDYKSSAKDLDPVLLAHGLQLQLLAYLAFIRRLPEPEKFFDVDKLLPAGVFYVNLSGDFGGGKTRTEVLGGLHDARQMAYQHSGRFDFNALKHLDNRDAECGTQFNYRLKQNGSPHGSCREVLPNEQFGKLLDDVEQHLVRMGKEIFSGVVKIDPYQKGNIRACAQCDYASICRIDQWQHQYRILKKDSVPKT